MSRKRIVILSLILALFTVFSLTSCLGANSSQDTSEETAEKVELVTPADASGNKPESDIFEYEYDSDGRIISCEYKKGEVTYRIGYNYNDEDGKVELYTFGNDGLADVSIYETSDKFDGSLGFCELEGGFYIKGYGDGALKLVEKETEEDTDAQTDDAETETDTNTETDTDTEMETETETETGD